MLLVGEAHDAYLHGLYFWFRGHNDEAEKYFRTATTLQPDYALGWTGLSEVYGSKAWGERRPKDNLPIAKKFALKAVSLDDSLPQAHLSLCASLFLADWNWPQAIEECTRATQLDPHFGEAYHFQAEILAALNRHTEAIVLARKASEEDPFSRPWGLPRSLQRARQYNAAIQEANARLASDPYDSGEPWVLSDVYRCKGMWKEEALSLQRTLELLGDMASASSVARDFEHGGYRAVVLGELERSQQKARTHYVSPVTLASFTAQLGQRKPTLTFLKKGFEDRNPDILFIQCDCAYDFLHSDERYRSIIKRIRRPPAY